jgi:hypothetical protein
MGRIRSMLVRDVGRWICLLGIALAIALVVISCGGGGGQGVFTGGGSDSSAPDATSGIPDGSLFGDGANGCQPKTCVERGYTCGQNGDGCGSILDCGTCTAPEYCGGGGYSKCGGNSGMGPDGAVVGNCTPLTCATSPNGPYNCGQTGDGCGGTLDCGACTNPQYCGGGGFNQCGGNNGYQPDGGVQCIPKACAAYPGVCGAQSDGCGGVTADCNPCTNPQYCGGGGPSVCGGNNGLNPDGGVPCTPLQSCPAGMNCGQSSDGCGGLITCGAACTNPQYCGGGGPSVCGGNNGLNPDASPICTPTTCALLGNPCGSQGDGCGGVLTCATCVLPQTCGGGGTPDKCGGNNGVGPDGGAICTPWDCSHYPATTCGVQSNGCGGITAACNPCTLPLTCGGGGVADKCGNSNLGADGGNLCTPATTCPVGVNCGQAADGCGGLITCGTCTAPSFCGGGGTAGQCGNSTVGPDGGTLCTPVTCTTAPGGPYNCGVVGNGCGGLTAACGTCTAPEFCGGAGPEVCGPTNIGGCTGGGSTIVKGFVYDPANNLPVYNALVYVPAGPVTTPPTGINTANPVCGCSAPPAYASAYTGIDGSFTLNNAPSGSSVTVVVQLGKWQRIYTETIGSCTTTTLSSHLTLPSTRAQGNIPRFAVDTGQVDYMECVLRKMGIAQAEFVSPAIAGGVPTAAGRVHFYEGSIEAGGAVIDANTPTEDKLTETASVMDSYDVILFPCQGAAGSYTAAHGWPNTRGNLVTYANDGGRVFTTHFHYDLLDGNGTFSGTANWKPNNGSWGNYYSDPTYPGFVDQTFARGVTLAAWLNQPIVYGPPLGQIPIGVIRNDFTSVNAPAQRWMYTQNNNPANIPIHYTFDTPFNQTPSCGRVVYSDFHVESEPNDIGDTGVAFPNECAPGAMTPQEKLLEFMLFDLTSCVGPATCTPLTCASFPSTTCGVQGDGCGGQTAFCNPCTAPATCGGGGVVDQCGEPDAGCTHLTCASFPNTCGLQGDGCGGQTAFCNPCTLPATCGGGGTPGKCGYPDAGCTPGGCGAAQCGFVANGCGGVTASCGTCAAGTTCENNQCVPVDGGSSCQPQTCTSLGLQCGLTDNGCGTLLTCPTCPAGQSCIFNKCVAIDAGACTPLTCGAYTACGEQGDGCGGVTPFCNPCTLPATCGGGGVAGQCGLPDAGACTPLTCAAYPGVCGQQSDGCGGSTTFCNPCTLPQTCGGGGAPGVCGLPDGGTCTGRTCQQEGISCGPAGDGCGNLIQCGSCPTGQSCGGAGVPGTCGAPDAGTCTPFTCSSLNIACGPAGDGCGNLLQCGTCSGTQTCGGGGTPGQCGGGSQ